MKTQATQTELTTLVKSRSSRSIPAYLTLSPRTNNQSIVQRHSFDLRVPTTPVSLCEYHQRLILRQTNSWSEQTCCAAVALPLTKSRSVHGITINGRTVDLTDDLRDDLMQICMSREDNQLRAKDYSLKAIDYTCDKSADEPFLTPLKPQIKSYSNDEVFIPKRDTLGEGMSSLTKA